MSSSYVIAAPEALAAASADFSGIGEALRAANAAASVPTTSLLAAAQDEVSAAIASLFGGYGQEYQAVSARVAAFHEQFVAAVRGGGLMYAAAEAANASPLSAAADAGARHPRCAQCAHRGVAGAPTDR